MNRFSQKKTHTPGKHDFFLTAVIALFALFLLVAETRNIKTAAQKQQLLSLRDALWRSALHCYCVEGRYPESLAYLKEHYGISWNEEEYLVDYEVLGANLKPGITVFARRPS